MSERARCRWFAGARHSVGTTTKEDAMGRIVVTEFVSLDGVMEGSGRGGGVGDLGDAVVQGAAGADRLKDGRRRHRDSHLRGRRLMRRAVEPEGRPAP
jgi:hypothetical protein